MFFQIYFCNMNSFAPLNIKIITNREKHLLHYPFAIGGKHVSDNKGIL